MGTPDKSQKPEAWEDPYRKPRSYKWLGLVALVLVLYVLSFGPAVAVVFKYGGQLPGAVTAVIEVIYKPLEYVRLHHPLISQPLEWYIELCLKLL